MALVGVGCLLFTAQGAVKAADRGVTLMSDRQHDLRAFRHHVDYETAWRQFAARVPSGSRVALTPARSNQELWHQRLTEFAALHGCVIVQGSTPDYVVGVALVKRNGRPHPVCGWTSGRSAEHNGTHPDSRCPRRSRRRFPTGLRDPSQPLPRTASRP
ncbi:hypothetical protein NKG94_30195 [Micromonospora sp. M12]